MRTWILRSWVLGIAVALAGAGTGCSAAPDEDTDASDEALDADWGEIDQDFSKVADAELENAALLSDLAEQQQLAQPSDDGPANDPDDDAEAFSDATATTAATGATGEQSAERPASCDPATSLDLVVYYERSDRDLLAGLARNARKCSRYWIAIPKVAASAANPDANLWPRLVKGEGVHALGPAFHATAEFHWGSTDARRYPGWKNVEVVNGATRRVAKGNVFRVGWYAKGVLFRQRMAKRGYLTQNGDTWHVNELESSWARSPGYLKAVKDLVRGLADGDPSYDAFTDTDPEIQAKTPAEKTAINESAHKKGVRGVVYIAAMGRRLPGETSDAPWKNAVKQALRSKRFWEAMANDVSFWGQERYASYPKYCAAGSLEAQSATLSTFQEALLDMARTAPRYKSGERKGRSTVATALSYLGRRYTPVIDGAWTPLAGDANRSADQVGDFIAGQVYAARVYDVRRDEPQGTLGIYWRPNDSRSDADNAKLAGHVAYVMNAIYDGKDGNPADGCGSGCRCGN